MRSSFDIMLSLLLVWCMLFLQISYMTTQDITTFTWHKMVDLSCHDAHYLILEREHLVNKNNRERGGSGWRRKKAERETLGQRGGWVGCELIETHLTPFTKYLSSKWTAIVSTSSRAQLSKQWPTYKIVINDSLNTILIKRKSDVKIVNAYVLGMWGA
jgi:hypothetical protein